MSRRVCRVVDCSNPVYARGLCKRDYNRWSYQGRPEMRLFVQGAHSKPAGEMESVIARIRERDPFLAAQFQHELNRLRAVKGRA